MLHKFPSLAIMQAFYGGNKLLSPPSGRLWAQSPILQLGTLNSGDSFEITWGEVALVVALLLLLIDIWKAFHRRDRALVQHILSFLLFVGSLVLFISVPGYGNPSYFIYLLIVLCGLAAGVLIMFAGRPVLYGVGGDGD